jgi:murein L,D-transpeptidase YafK
MLNRCEKIILILCVLLGSVFILLACDTTQAHRNNNTELGNTLINEDTIKLPPLLKSKVDSIVVLKSKGLLQVFAHGALLKKYDCSVGSNPIGHKLQQGDNRTPEGLYKITDRNANSKYYKNLHISYPNTQDIASAQARGVHPGGNIKIHGIATRSIMDKKYSSTWGCIGLTNAAMDELYKYVPIPCTINILP